MIKEIIGEKSSLRNKIFSAIFGVLGCGGVLQIPAAVCFIYLLLLIWAFFCRRDRFKVALALFVFVLTGALGNAFAPGNFARQVFILAGEIHVFRAIKYSVYMTVQEIYYIIKDTYFLFVFWISFICFYGKVPVYKVNKFNSPIGILATVVIGSTITNFPMALARVSTYMDNRNYSTLDLFLIIGLLFFLYALINYFRSKLRIEIGKKEFLISAMCISIGYISCQDRMDIFKSPPFLCMKQLKESQIQLSAKEWVDLFEYLENCEEDELVLPYPIYYQDILVTMSLQDNPKHWVNRDLAEYFQKSSISFSDTAGPWEGK